MLRTFDVARARTTRAMIQVTCFCGLLAGATDRGEPPVLGHGTSEVILVGPTGIVAAADSKEILDSWLDDGSSVRDEKNVCKLRRVGPIVAMVAGYVRANGFNALDEVQDLYRDGDTVEGLADTLSAKLPARFLPALTAVAQVGDDALRETLKKDDVLEIALLGFENNAPTARVLVFGASISGESGLGIHVKTQSCPGQCPNGETAWYLGVHEEIDNLVNRNPALRGIESTDYALTLAGLEYASRSDVVGGPVSIVRIDGSGTAMVREGACDSWDRPTVGGAIVSTDRGGASPYLDVIRDELDGRLAAVSNLICHEHLERHSRRGKRVETDRVDAELSIIDGKEEYTRVTRNGKDVASFYDLPGAWVQGELATMLWITRSAVQSEKATIVDSESRKLIGVRYSVTPEKKAWVLRVETAQYPVGFDGEAWFRKGSGGLISIAWTSNSFHPPAESRIIAVKWEVTFSSVDIFGKPFVVPAKSTFRVEYDAKAGREDWTEANFSNFKRYAAESTIAFE